MPHDDIIRALLAAAHQPAEHREARSAWITRTADACHEAHRAMDDRCGEAVDHLSEEEFERLFDEEQAKVAAILAQLKAVAEHDRWPRELHFGGI